MSTNKDISIKYVHIAYIFGERVSPSMTEQKPVRMSLSKEKTSNQCQRERKQSLLYWFLFDENSL